MKFMMRPALQILFLFACMLTAASVSAQEVLRPLHTNPQLEQISNGPRKQFQHGPPHVQKLPFFDDFSNYDGLYPNDTMWLDNFTYISKDFAGNTAPSTGVVVFEGLNAKGRPYRGIEETASFPSDTLTSTYIDLSSYSESDSLYLSFFYEPKGLGDAPEPGDSLVLQFHPDSAMIGSKWDTNAWIHVWSVPGSNNAQFKLAMIPIRAITGRNYFHGKFQFRLVAYSNQSGNMDHWLVDYVYLNQGRTLQEKTFDDVAIYKKSRSILNTYYAMPVRQAQAMTNPFASNISIYGSNNSANTKNVAYRYEISNQQTGAVLDSSKTQADNLLAGERKEFTLTNTFSKNFLQGEYMKLLVKTKVITPDDFHRNDSAIHVQEFGDYLAYDDGTAENAYGLENVSLGKVAVRFILPKTDTLYGVAVHFTFGLKDVSNQNFTLAIWDKLTETGKPENDQPVRRINFVFPQYTNRVNGYYYFKLSEPLAVKDQFYVGWIQTKDFRMEVGADLNYTDLNPGTVNPNLYVSLQGSWKLTDLNFAPMIRPYLGKDFVEGMPVIDQRPEMQVKIYPNPTQGVIHVETTDTHPMSAVLFSLDGRQVSGTTTFSQSTTLNYPHLKPGMYLLRFRTNEGIVHCEKVIVR
jgi:hypothetical protein